MRIFIPYPTSGLGGPFTFVNYFRQGLVQNGHHVLNSFSFKFDTLFIIAECSLWKAAYAKLTGKKVIQRLDGVYYPGLPGWNGRIWWFKNLRMLLIHNYVTDTVVYQSEFSKQSCQKLFRYTHPNSIIIYNGVAGSNNLKKPEATSPVQLVTTGRFRRTDQIEPLLESFKKLPQNFELTVYGSYTPQLASFFKNMPRVHFKKAVSHQQLVDELKNYHIFTFSDQSACPNAVLEALRVGLPVVAFDRGSISELVEDTVDGRVVSLAPHDPWAKPYIFSKADYTVFAEAVQDVASSAPNYQNIAERAEHRFSVEKMMQLYLDAITT